MSTFNREAVVEDLKRVLDPWVVTHHNGCHGDDDWGSSLSVKEGGELAEAALPVAVKAVTDAVRAHHVTCDEKSSRPGYCYACVQAAPCPTVRLLDEIDTAAGVTR